MPRPTYTPEESKRRALDAHARYEAENTIRIMVKLNKNTDAEIISALENEPSKQGFIKWCIREHLERKALKDE